MVVMFFTSEGACGCTECNRPVRDSRPRTAMSSPAQPWVAFGVCVIGTQVIPAEVERLADKVAETIVNNPDRIAATQGEITIVAYRDAGQFGRLTLEATTLIAPTCQRFTDAQLRRLGSDAGQRSARGRHRSARP